jgi:hypothetical protein
LNIEQDFLLSLVTDTTTPETEKYLFCISKDLSFSELNKPAYEFILKFYKEHKQFPDSKLLSDRYPNVFLPQELTAPFSFYKKEMVDLSGKKYMGQIFERANVALNKSGPDTAVEIVSSGIRGYFSTKQEETQETAKKSFKPIWKEYQQDKEDGKFFGLLTGNDEIDRHTKGILPEQIVAYMARPGSLKSMLAAEFALQFAKEQRTAKTWIPEGDVLLISPEMSTKEFLERIYCNAGKLRLDDYMNGNLIEEDAQSIENALNDLHRDIIIRTDIFDAFQLMAVCHKIKPIILIIDGAYLLAKSKKHEDQSELLKFLKSMIAEKNSPIKGMPIVCFSQLNKQGEVGFADSWIQDPNVVITFERLPAKNNENNNGKNGKELLTNQLEFSSEKVRRGKGFVRVKMWFDERNSRFVNGQIPQDVIATDNKRKMENDEVPQQVINRPRGIENDPLF